MARILIVQHPHSEFDKIVRNRYEPQGVIMVDACEQWQEVQQQTNHILYRFILVEKDIEKSDDGFEYVRRLRFDDGTDEGYVLNSVLILLPRYDTPDSQKDVFAIIPPRSQMSKLPRDQHGNKQQCLLISYRKFYFTLDKLLSGSVAKP